MLPNFINELCTCPLAPRYARGFALCTCGLLPAPAPSISLPGVAARRRKTGPVCGCEFVGDSSKFSCCCCFGVEGAACVLEGVVVETERVWRVESRRWAEGSRDSGVRDSGVLGGREWGDGDAAAATACE